MGAREASGTGASAGQFVIFTLGKEHYGVEVSRVREIIRLPETVRVPQTPPYVEGLANLRGSILTMINGRSKFGLEKADYNEATRVLVLEQGQRVLGCIVDRVAEVAVVKPEQVEEIADAEATNDFVKAVAKLNGGERLVMLVDADLLLNGAEGDFEGESPAEGRLEERDTTEAAVEGVQEAEEQLVSFRLGGEEYAVAIASVQEIVHLPDEFSRPPTFPHYFEGIVTLRNRVLPVVSLRVLFNLPRREFDDRTRVVVLNVQKGGSTCTVGITVDAVAEVLRVPRSAIEDVPAALRSLKTEEILGVCKIQEGRRLVYLLDPAKLLPLEELKEFASAQAEHEALVHKSASTEEEHLVTFQLYGQEYAVNIGQVQEIIRMSTVVAIPKAPAFVEGVINLRGMVIPVIDLRARFGLPPKDGDEQDRIIVVDIDGVKTGYRVDSVREVLKIPRGDIEKISEICTGWAPFFRGVGKVEKAGRMIIILDLAELLSDAEKEELNSMEVPE